MSAYQIYNTKFPISEVSQVIDALSVATEGTNRDLLIASMIVYILWLSDPSVTDNAARLKAAAASVADHICLVLGMPANQINQTIFH